MSKDFIRRTITPGSKHILSCAEPYYSYIKRRFFDASMVNTLFMIIPAKAGTLLTEVIPNE